MNRRLRLALGVVFTVLAAVLLGGVVASFILAAVFDWSTSLVDAAGLLALLALPLGSIAVVGALACLKGGDDQ